MRPYPRRHLATMAAVALIPILAACSSAAPSGASGATATVDAGPPQSGGTLRTSSIYDTKNLDFQAEPGYVTQNSVKFVYSKLLAYKTGPDVPYGSNELVGDLAESWEPNEDATVWTFHLRKGVKFQNIPPVNGRELTSADVLCTTDRIKSLPSFQQAFLSYVSDIQAPDDSTVVFTLSQPYVAFAENLAAPSFMILPCEGAKGEYDLKTQAIGTGPFMLENWTPGDKERVYVKNPDYYEEGKPYLDKVTQVYLNDPQALTAATRSGQFDLVYLNDKQSIDNIVSQVPGFTQSLEGGLEQNRVFINAERAPFDDLRVRRAIALALDKTGANAALNPETTLTGPVSPNLFGGLSPDEVNEAIPFNPEEAKQLLAEAGQANLTTTLVINSSYGDGMARRAQWVQEDLSKVGINAEIVVQDHATYMANWQGKNYDIIVGAMAGSLTADSALTTEWLSTGSRNWAGVNDPTLDEMITQQRSIGDPAAREEALKNASRYILTEVGTPIPLGSIYAYFGRSDRVHNYYPHPDFSFLYYKDIWMTPES